MSNLIKIENQNNSAGSSVTGINTIVHKVGGTEKFKMVFDTTSNSGKSMNVTGDIIPISDATFQLGSGSKRWSHIFQGTSSLYMGNDSVLTVSGGKMVIKNRKDGNLFPPPFWHQKHALFKYGIKTSVQQDPLTRKIRNYIGTIQFDDKVKNSGFSSTNNGVLTFSDTTVSLSSGSITDGTYTISQSSTNGSGTGFICKATFSSNATTEVKIVSHGSGYSAGNTITFTNQNSETNSLVLTVATVGYVSEIEINDSSTNTENEENNFYKDWYMKTVGTVSGTSTTIFAKTTAYNASTKKISIQNWFSDSSHETAVTVTAIDNGTLFNLKSPAAYSSKTQSKLNEITKSNRTIHTVTSQTDFILKVTADVNGAVTNSTTLVVDNNNGTIIEGMTVTGTGIKSGTTIVSITDQNNLVMSSKQTISNNTNLIFSDLSTTNDFYNKIYVLKVTQSNVDYFAKVTDWVASTFTIKVASNQWHEDISLGMLHSSQPTIAADDAFELIPFKIRLVDLNIENILNILENDVPNAKDYKKYDSFGDDLDKDTFTSFTSDVESNAVWEAAYIYDTNGNITSSLDRETGTYKSGSTIDFYDTTYDHGTGYQATSIGESSTFRSVAISQTSITSGTYNTIEVILPSNDSNSLSATQDYTGYELQLKDTDGHIEYHTVASSTSVTVDSVAHPKITVSFPFYSKPTTSHTYLLINYVNAYNEMGGDTGYSASDQSTGITSLNYQIKLDSIAISEDNYYNGYKITVDVYDSTNFTTTSISGTVTSYSGSTKIASISQSTYSGGGIQWTTNGSRASKIPNSSGFDYYVLEKSGGSADYQTNYYQAGTITYDPMKTFQDNSYSDLDAAIAGGMDRELYKYMETIQNDSDALNFDQFDASNAVAYNWSDYFYENKNWYGSTNAMYTNETTIVGTETPPTGTLYCKLSVYGSMKTRVLLSLPTNTTSNNIKKITTDYKDKGYIFSKGLYIANQSLDSIALRSNDINLSDGGLIVKGTAQFDGGLISSGDITANSFTSTSDRKYKKNINPIDNNELLMKLKPITFNWKKDEANKTVYGFIAQDVKEIFPDMIKKEEKYNKLSMDYIQIIPLLVKQIQDLTKEVEKMKLKLQNLK